MTELSTNSGLQEQLGVFLNVKQQKWSELKTLNDEFLSKNFIV